MKNELKRIVYLTEEEYAEVSNGKKNINDFPNPYVKEIDNVRYQIIPANEICTSSVLTDEEKTWFIPFPTNDDVVRLEVSKSSSFPTELVAGVDRSSGMFSMGNTLSKKTGWIKANGCLGCRSALFFKSKVHDAIEILNDFGFAFQHIYYSTPYGC